MTKVQGGTSQYSSYYYFQNFYFQNVAAKFAQLVTNRMTYADAKAFCSAQSVTYFGKTMNAQMMDISGTSYTYLDRKLSIIFFETTELKIY